MSAKIPYSIKLDSTSAKVIEELRKKPTGGLNGKNSVITHLVESHPEFIAGLKKLNKNKK